MNSFNFFYLAGALVAGMLIPFQTGFNTQLGRALNGPFYAAASVFAAGFLAMCLVLLVVRPAIPNFADAARAPIPSWFMGGVLGAAYIVALTIVAPKLGAAQSVVLVMAGQILCSTIIDHFGLLGFAVHPLTLLRLAGFALIAGGVALVRMF